MDIKSFDNYDEMQDFLKEVNRTARKWADEVGAVGIIDRYNYFGMVAYDLVIIGKKEPATLPEDQYDDKSEYEYEKKSAEEDKKNGYVWARWYSHIEPKGELGTNHLSQCIPLPDKFGEAIRKLVAGE